MSMSFEIENNYEFYCYLKFNLPEGICVISEPSPGYYSEWDFDYKITKGEEILECFKGNFREINEGVLVAKAHQILNKYKKLLC